MAINGNNIIVLSGGTAIAGTKSDELQVECETIEIASSTDQGWTHYLAGRKSWSLTVGWLLLATTDVRKISRSEERRIGKECRSRWSPYH